MATIVEKLTTLTVSVTVLLGDSAIAGIRHVGKLSVRGNGDAYRAVSHTDGRCNCIAGSADYRNSIFAGIRYVDKLPIRGDGDAYRVISYVNGRGDRVAGCIDH
jgi:hypothetical protein